MKKIVLSVILILFSFGIMTVYGSEEEWIVLEEVFSDPEITVELIINENEEATVSEDFFYEYTVSYDQTGSPVYYEPVALSYEFLEALSATGDPLTITKTLYKGLADEEVYAVQQRLYELGYLKVEPDGIFGNYTEAAVNAFQKANGLSYQDGMVGSWTIGKLNDDPVPASDDEGQTSSGNLSISQTLAKGMSGEEVYYVQQRLYELGYLKVQPDGIYGSYTEAAVNAFQKANGLSYQDGKVGSWTIGKLNGDPIPAGSNEEDDPETPNGSQIKDLHLDLTRDLSYGTSGEDVYILQLRLIELGYLSVQADGIFGKYTEQAVNSFQIANGLTEATGLVSDWTAGKLNGTPVDKDHASISAVLKTSEGSVKISRSLCVEMEGDDVRALQERLYELGYMIAVPKGYFGNMTYEAVMAFQKDRGMDSPTGIVDKWTIDQLNSNQTYAVNAPEYVISSLVDDQDCITDKNYNREDYNIRFIIPHHMEGHMTGEDCSYYFLNNEKENSANYCIGYDGDISVSVPENYGAWTSNWYAADEQGITIEVSDDSAESNYIPEKALESLIYLCVDLIQRNPSLGGQMIYDPADRDIVIAAKKADDPEMLEQVKGNVLLHNWTSGGTTTCPGKYMTENMPKIAEKVNDLLANPGKKLDLSDITGITQQEQ